jgi:hypothetical protein
MTWERRLARIATVGSDATADMVRAGMWSYNAEHDSIDVGGQDLARTREHCDVERSGRAAPVVGPRGGRARSRSALVRRGIHMLISRTPAHARASLPQTQR